jgi:hypothetical protein
VCGCDVVMTNEKRQTFKKHILFLLRQKFSFASKNKKISRSLFCHCSARAILFKKRHLTALHVGQTVRRTIYPCAVITTVCLIARVYHAVFLLGVDYLQRE